MPDGFTGYVWTETVSAKKKKLRIKKYPDTWVWRHIGDIIDSHISWPWKHFLTSKIVLRVIWLLSIIFVASVPCLRVFVSFVRVMVLSSSGLRWPFSRVVNPFRRLLRGCVVFMSSCRPFFLSSTLLHI